MSVRALFVAVLFALAGSAQAAGNAPTHHFKSTFVQTRTLPDFNAPLVSHGILSFDAEQGFRWEITTPYHYMFEMHNGEAREVLPDGTVRRLDPDQTPWLAAVQHSFISALSGDRSDLKRYFDVTIEPLAEGRRITLTPKPGPMPQAIVRIEIVESAPGHPERLEIEETSGAHMEIRFSPATSSTGQP